MVDDGIGAEEQRSQESLNMAVALSLAENEEAREQKHRRSPGCSALVRDGIAQGRDFVPW